MYIVISAFNERDHFKMIFPYLTTDKEYFRLDKNNLKNHLIKIRNVYIVKCTRLYFQCLQLKLTSL